MNYYPLALGDLLRWEQFYRGHVDYFEYVDSDCRRLREGTTLVYALDAYDANTLVYPAEVCASRLNQHYDATRAMWRVFIQDAQKQEQLHVAIGPLALLECVFYLQKHAQAAVTGPGLTHLLQVDVTSIIEEMERACNVLVDRQSIPWSLLGRSVQRAWIEMTSAVNAAQSFESPEPAGLAQLLAMVKRGEIRYLDHYLDELGLKRPPDFFLSAINTVDPAQAQRYLDEKRGAEGWNKMYNAIDVNRFIAGARLSPLFQKKNVSAFVTSTGLLTLNAWDKSWLGKPSEWPARPAIAASYVSYYLKRYDSNWKTITTETEEARITARRIARHLGELEQVGACSDPKVRQNADKSQMVEVPERLVLEMLEWQQSYYSELNPLKRDPDNTLFGAKALSINLQQLIEWRDSPRRREMVSDRIRAETSHLLNTQDFLDFDGLPLVGPLGDAYEGLNRWLAG